MSDSAPSSPSVVPSNLGVISASDMESHSESASLSDSDFEVVLVAQATAALAVSDTDSGSLVSVPTDFVESSDEEHIFVPNIAQSAPNTPRPPFVNPARSTGTPRPALSAIARPVIELGHESDASDREDDSSVDDSDSGSEDGSVLRARARPVTITNDRLEAPINSISTTITLHSNTSTATIRPVTSVHSSLARRAGMHTTPVTTNTIVGIVSFAPLPPITPSDGGEISYVPFTAAPSAVSVPVLDGVRRSMPVTRTISAPAVAATSIQPSSPRSTPPPVPGGIVGKKKWSHMNSTRLTLGFTPLKHILRLKQNCEVSQKAAEEKGTPRARAEAAARAKAQEEAIARVQMHKEASAKAHAEAQARKRAKAEANKKAQAEAKAKATVKSAAKVTGKKWKAKTEAKSLVAPPPTVGASPVTSEDEAPRMRASMFLPADHASIPNEGPEDEEAYDAAIKQLDEHMLSPPEHPTATYRHLLNQALLLEFRICTPETLPRSHGATIAMVKTNVHINILDYVAKRKEGFSGLRAAMLENAKALRKDVRKRRMPVTTVKSLGLQSLLVLH